MQKVLEMVFPLWPRSGQLARRKFGFNVEARYQGNTEAGQCSLDQHSMKIVACTNRWIGKWIPVSWG